MTLNQVIPAKQLGNLTYVPGTNEVGSKTFTIQASDGATLSSALTVTMTLAPTWNQGSGNWDLSSANWSGTTWTNGSAAFIGGTAGSTITLSTAGISAASLTFNVTGDTIAASGGNILTLIGTPFVSVGTGLLATISAPIAGTAVLKKSGEGSLLLTASGNTFTGTTAVSAGTLRLVGTQASTVYTVSGGALQVDAGAGGVLPSTASLTLGTGFDGARGSFIYDNFGATAARTQTLASLTTVLALASENVVQVSRSAAQPVSLIFTTLSANATECGNIVNFVTTDTAGGGLNGTDYKIVLGNQTGFKIANQNAYFNGSDFAVYDTSAGTGLSGFVRGIKYGVDAGTATSAGRTSFAATTAQEITGSITAQPTVSLSSGTINGSLKIVGLSNLTMLAGATLTISQAGNTGAGGLLKTGVAGRR